MSHKLRKHTRIDVRDAELIAYYPLLAPRSCQVLDYGMGGARCLLKTKDLDEISSRSWVAALMLRSDLEFELTRVSSKRLRASVRHAAVLNEDSVVFGLAFKSDDPDSRVSLERARVIFHQQAVDLPAATSASRLNSVKPEAVSFTEELLQDEDLEPIEAAEVNVQPQETPRSNDAPLTYEVVGPVEVISAGDSEEEPSHAANPKARRSRTQAHRLRSSRKLRIVLENVETPPPPEREENATPPEGDSAGSTKPRPNLERKNDSELPSEQNFKSRADIAVLRAGLEYAELARERVAAFLRSVYSQFAVSGEQPNYRSMRLGEIVRAVNCCSEAQIEEWTQGAQSRDMRLGAFLVHEKIVTPRELFRMLSLQSGLPTVNLNETPTAENCTRLARRHCRTLRIVPFNQVGNSLYVACSRRLTQLEVRQLELDCGHSIKLFLASDDDLDEFIQLLD